MPSRLMPYTYAMVYLGSVLLFGFAAHPDIWQDYIRVGAFALLATVVIWIIEIAVRYKERWCHLHPDQRQRMMKPRNVYFMGISYLFLLVPAAKNVVDLFGEGLRWYSLPPLLLSLGFAVAWLYPLLLHQKKMREQEEEAGAFYARDHPA